jgi:hypothetical protein
MLATSRMRTENGAVLGMRAFCHKVHKVGAMLCILEKFRQKEKLICF